MLSAFLISLPLFLFALVAHEYAHGWVANKLGDPTARHHGRLTFNPLAHIDMFGTILLPVSLLLMHSPFIIGWAKPIPINFSYLRNPKRDMFWVGISGPLVNLLLAALLATLLKIAVFQQPAAGFLQVVRFAIFHLVLINAALGIFNLLPVPPLDGSRILFSILPDKLAFSYIKLEPYGIFLLIMLMWMGVVNKFVWPVVRLFMRGFGLI